ncbi:MAG TPA: exodeoxyribonuclease VII large subunit, partial [Geobacteraceae bacterium]|nr:exodeoxyribonuclease VII large subunit [Geobacteraceae bacterium]
EVSNLAMPGSGHFYFTLKDAGAQLRCVMFRASARQLRFKPKDGMGLIVRGRMTVFEPRGDYQLIVEYLEPQGIGALQLAFVQLKERLAREGFFEESRKKPIPRLPQRIGIITSATGAAIHDILHVLDRRFANVEVLISPVKVQGEGAAQEIAGAIRDFNRYRDIDVMIVGRGGGSLEDLWAFNEEAVARAIFASRIPVISAVGHEVDFTIADFVADLRAPTPSAAAELVIKSKEELEAGLTALSHRLRIAMIHRLAVVSGELENLARSIKEPSMLLGRLAQQLDHLSERLSAAAREGMVRRAERLVFFRNHLRLVTPAVQVERARELLLSLEARGENAIQRALDRSREAAAVSAGKLQSLSPLLTLSRGYAIACRLPDKSAVRDGRTLVPGDRLDLTFQRGGALCVVERSRD